MWARWSGPTAPPLSAEPCPATSSWSIAGIALALGPNAITVSGSNVAGVAASDTVTLTRDPYAGPGSPVHYVALDSPASAWPYTNWTSAAHTLQDAVDTADTGDTVLVSNGVYNAGSKVTPGGIEPNRVTITRDILVQSVNGPSNTLIVGVGPIGSSAMRCAYLTTGALSGFTLTNGFSQSGSSVYDESGGGVLLNGGGTVSNCVVTGCMAYDCGGGIGILNNGTVNNCTIAGNTSRSVGVGGGAGTGGGGVLCHNGGTLNNCVIRNNTASKSSSGGGAGGGVDCEQGGTVNNCFISNNTASANGGGGGVYCTQGGSIRNSTLCNNTSPGGQGGGILCDSGGATLQNCLLYGNTSADGGGLYSYQGVTVRNCTFAGNSNTTPDNGTGIYLGSGGTVQNCIIVGNLGGGTNIYNPAGGVIGYSCSPGLSGSGNITNNPLFVNAAANNYRLSAGSPCINAGNNAYAQGATDLDDNPRIIGGVVDMGAYESTSGSTANGIPWAWLLKYGLATDGSADHQQADADTFDNLQEYVADLNPTNAASFFAITAVSNLPPWTVYFESSAGRRYTLTGVSNLASGAWSPVPGAGPRPGTGGPDALSDTNVPPKGPFYKLRVELP